MCRSVGETGVCLVLLLATVGCSDAPEILPVEGKVLYQGSPLEYGSIMFQPLGGGGAARGQIQPDGTFQLTTRTEGDGVQVGKSRVRVTAYEAQRPGAVTSTTEEIPLGSSAIPDKYTNFGTSGIEVEVTPDMPKPLVIRLE